MSIADFENIPEFSGKPYIGCIFQFADTDNDGYITVNDFVAAMEGSGEGSTARMKNFIVSLLLAEITSSIATPS